MYCWKCGKENRDENRFCTSCGAELKKAGQAAPSAAASGGVRGPSAPAQESKGKKKGTWTYFLVAAVALIVSIVNINDMKNGPTYTVLFGIIPIQYVMIPAGVIALIMGVAESRKK